MYAISTVGSLRRHVPGRAAADPARRHPAHVPGLRARAGARRRARARAALAAAPALVAALLALPPGTIKGSDEGRVIYETETEYQYARVVEYEGGVRRLELNEGQAIHSTYRPGHRADRQLLGRAARRPVRRAARARRGASRCSAPRPARPPAPTRATCPDTRVDAVEIDGELLDIGRRYFDLRGPARSCARSPRTRGRSCAAPSERYDVIMVDAYRQPYIPFYLTTQGVLRARPRPARARAAWWRSTSATRRAPTGSSRCCSATLRVGVRRTSRATR